MTHSTHALKLAVLSVALLASSVGAQEERKPSPAEICAAAAKVVATAPDPRIRSAAYVILSRCPNAAASLASVWATPPVDAEALAQLRWKSASLSDRRILDATLPVVQNAGLSESTRRAALDVVLAQYAPSVAISTATWADPEHASLAVQSDYYQVPGEQPIAAADRQRIIDTFRQMGTTATDVQWRRIATRIVHDLPPNQ
jgi:hypothetical protein